LSNTPSSATDLDQTKPGPVSLQEALCFWLRSSVSAAGLCSPGVWFFIRTLRRQTLWGVYPVFWVQLLMVPPLRWVTLKSLCGPTQSNQTLLPRHSVPRLGSACHNEGIAPGAATAQRLRSAYGKGAADLKPKQGKARQDQQLREQCRSSLLAMSSKATHFSRQHALSFTSIASRLAPTVDIGSAYRF
jgi:hypothetical protein